MLNLVVAHATKHMKIKVKKYEGSKKLKPLIGHSFKSFHKLPSGKQLKDFLDAPFGLKKKRAIIRQCHKHIRYATYEEARAVAKRFGNRVFKCCIKEGGCSGGFHTTSKRGSKRKIRG
jgi:hypothetical protein